MYVLRCISSNGNKAIDEGLLAGMFVLSIMMWFSKNVFVVNAVVLF